jgi:phosphocarrier protein HPr
MTDEFLSRQVTVRNPQGLHMRPADLLVKTAARYSSKIEIEREGQAVNGKSILDVLMLGAQQGCELVIRACGDDADEALNKLVELFENGFFEADAEVASPPPV